MNFQKTLSPGSCAGPRRRFALLGVTACAFGFLALGGCASVPATSPPASSPTQSPSAETVLPAVPPPTPGEGGGIPAATPDSFPLLKPAGWERIPDWQSDSLVEAWPAWMQSCRALAEKPLWKQVCGQAAFVDGTREDEVRAYFQRYFIPHEVIDPNSGREGLVTGYYEPIISGDRKRTSRARHPIYGQPHDLVSVELSSLYPQLKFMRLRGRVVGNSLLPYFTREEIEKSESGFRGDPIAWADDPVDLFFLQVQGSGRVELPDGKHLRIGYADQNGHPFRSVARILIEQGELRESGASMQAVRKWGRDNPHKIAGLLNRNPSYVFFKEMPDGLSGPLGALGVPLTEKRSIAVDPRHVPLGAPLFLATTWPLSDRPLNRLVMAQDTGGAIRGPVRADFFWGCGDAAGALAGRMKQKGRAWVLMPREFAKDNKLVSRGDTSK